MATYSYNMVPREVAKVETKWRRICTSLPVPESLPLFERMRKCEPISMVGQPPVVWDRAEGVNVYDRWGNKWLDWSSGVLITNAGHGHPEICAAIKEVVDKPLLSTYIFTHERRIELCELLASTAPKGLDKAYLLSAGTEATETAVKMARTYGMSKYGSRKHVIVTFTGAFHGRTMGAVVIGGSAKAKEWIAELPGGYVHVPFPDGFYNEDTSFDVFLQTIKDAGYTPDDIAGVISEAYQGVGPNFFPDEYARKLGKWCKANDVVLIMDEVQSGFGRTGKFYCWQWYDLVPDLICCGKGITSSLPLSAVIGRNDIMDLFPPRSMTSTHSGSPLPVAAALANLKVLLREDLSGRAQQLSVRFGEALDTLSARHRTRIGACYHRGLVGGMLVVKPGTKEPDPGMALALNQACYERGLLMFAPVGIYGECIKICPPLTTPEDALEEGLYVLSEAMDEILGE